MRFKNYFGMLFVILATFLGSQTLHAKIDWLLDYQQAHQQSIQENKPIFMFFTGSTWCIYCVRLTAEVFEAPEFEKWIQKNFIPLELDFPSGSWPQDKKKYEKQYTDLARQYGIAGFPTVVVLSPQGKKLTQLGYMKGGSEKWIQYAEENLKGSLRN